MSSGDEHQASKCLHSTRLDKWIEDKCLAIGSLSARVAVLVEETSRLRLRVTRVEEGIRCTESTLIKLSRAEMSPAFLLNLASQINFNAKEENGKGNDDDHETYSHMSASLSRRSSPTIASLM
jgi:hypothetical protein